MTNTEMGRKIQELQTELNKVRSQLDSGEDVNLTLFQLEVQELTQHMQTLSPEDADILKEPLLNLLSDVESIYDRMKERLKEIQEKLQNFSSSSKAAQAYQDKKP